jgi:hypothetical protein
MDPDNHGPSIVPGKSIHIGLDRNVVNSLVDNVCLGGRGSTELGQLRCCKYSVEGSKE